jgi:hypothetical protein
MEEGKRGGKERRVRRRTNEKDKRGRRWSKLVIFKDNKHKVGDQGGYSVRGKGQTTRSHL